MKLPSIFKKNGKPKIDPDIKNRMLKNNDAVLQVLGEGLQGNKCCPLLGGNPCIGKMCMFWMEFTNSQKDVPNYWMCAHVKTPLLIIENANAIRKLTAIMEGTKNEKNT